ncbi:MAG TPA: hypothetical protein VFH82_09765 [Gemmatimonadota bacterium]|jgi:hypothetical protein|nr:hypothetical protein [Gemmatimonadota bacterium]
MKALTAFAALASMVLACGEEPSAPRQAGPVAAASPGVAASAPTCPCWDAEALIGALPKADVCIDQSATDTPFVSVDLFDFSAATQTQAFTRYDAASAAAGSCRLAVVGTQGLVREIAAETGFPRADYEGCAALLAERARATAAGC